MGGGCQMEVITIAGVAVVAVGGWYSVADVLEDMGIKIRRRNRVNTKIFRYFSTNGRSVQRNVKQMAGVNI